MSQISCAAIRACYLTTQGNAICPQDAVTAPQDSFLLISTGAHGGAGSSHRSDLTRCAAQGVAHACGISAEGLLVQAARAPLHSSPADIPVPQRCWGASTAAFSPLPGGLFTDVAAGIESTCAIVAFSGVVGLARPRWPPRLIVRARVSLCALGARNRGMRPAECLRPLCAPL